MKLYKYRSLENLDFFLDIIVNSRLYAATYESLNDPMEGYFRYRSTNIGFNLLQEIRSMKKETRILSLVRTPSDMLMWSYYANGHRGIVLGVTVEENEDYIIKPVEYKKYGAFITRRLGADAAVEKLLTTKYSTWDHEEEIRVLTQKKYVKVKINKLIFGKNVSKEKERIVTKIANKFNVSNIRKLTRNDVNEFA